jgi:hypothetical protein
MLITFDICACQKQASRSNQLGQVALDFRSTFQRWRPFMASPYDIGLDKNPANFNMSYEDAAAGIDAFLGKRPVDWPSG